LKSLFLYSAGTGFEQAFLDREHEALVIPDCYNFNEVVEILNDVKIKYDATFVQPPCKTFSVAAFGHHWTGGKCAYIPRTEEAKEALSEMQSLLTLLTNGKITKFFFVENPMGLLRKMSFMQPYKRYEITYCQYGDNRMKPTDIWSNFLWWNPRKKCKNGDLCHEAAPRGSRTGTQKRKTHSEKKAVPYALSLELCKILEENNKLKHEGI